MRRRSISVIACFRVCLHDTASVLVSLIPYHSFFQKSTPRSRSSSSGSASTITSHVTSSSSSDTSAYDAPNEFKPPSEYSVFSEGNKYLTKSNQSETQPDISLLACTIDQTEPNNKIIAKDVTSTKDVIVSKPLLSREECEAIKRSMRKGARTKRPPSNKASRLTPKANTTVITEASPASSNNSTPRAAPNNSTPRAAPKPSPNVTPVPSPHLPRNTTMLSKAEVFLYVMKQIWPS